MNIVRRLKWQIDREWIRVNYKGHPTGRHYLMAVIPTIAVTPLVILLFELDHRGIAKICAGLGAGTTFIILQWINCRAMGATGLGAVGRTEKFNRARKIRARRGDRGTQPARHCVAQN